MNMRTLLALVLFMASSVAASAAPRWGDILKQPADWYASAEAADVARAVIAFQTESGGWPKNIDMTAPPSATFLADTGSGRLPTIDNGGTTTPIQFLVRVVAATGDADALAAVRAGLGYLLDAQYENGGWPQFYPLRGRYYDHITYNDNAMVRVLDVLRDAVEGQDEWAGVADPDLRAKLASAFERGIRCVLATQVVVDGELTVWCAQHDETTLAPVAARAFEPVSLSGSESASLVSFLMRLRDPSSEVERAIEAAVKWFGRTAIAGRHAVRNQQDQFLEVDPTVDTWARFYEIGTNRPIFVGRDEIVHYDLAQIEQERRTGYSYYGDWPAKVLSEVGKWRQRNAKSTTGPVIFLAGDSTMADKPRLAYPERGWGQMLRDRVQGPWRVDNHAVNGRSTKSFLDEGRWRELISAVKPDDWVIIQFGHNDEKSQDPKRYTEPRGAYRDNLLHMVAQVRARQAHPVLATPVARRKWNADGTALVPTHGDYPAAVRELAAELDVALLDLEQRTIELVASWGPVRSKDLHLWIEDGAHPARVGALADDTHYSEIGARAVASLAIDEMRRLKLPIVEAFAGLSWTPDAVVALDGSGDYTSIEAAIYGANQQRAEPGKAFPRWNILVKPGVYRERVYVQRERGNIALIGEDPARTVLVNDIHANMIGPDGKKLGTFRTPTLQVDGDGFVVENLTIANDAGPVGQALALRVDGDRVVFRNCRFLGWQDTILVNRGRHYFADCYIEGHVDFIFGAANSVFERCAIRCLGNGYITAASTPVDQTHGLTFLDCRVDAEPGVTTYLGRPWRAHAKTTFVRSQLGSVVRAEGWHNWNQPEREQTTRYVEQGSTGPGAASEQRAPWAHPLTADEAGALRAAEILRGEDGWEIPLPISR